MGLLDSIIGNEPAKNAEEHEFKALIVDTTNVVKELKNIAAANHLKPTDLSFKLLKVTTFSSDEKSENNEMGEEEMKLFYDDAFLLKPTIKFNQFYRIEIFKTDSIENPIAIPNITLSANKNLTKVVATLYKSNDINFSSKLEEAIIEDINCKKIKAGILIGVRDQNMHKEVKKILANLRVNGIIDQTHMFVVAEGLDETPSINDDLIFHYKKKINAKNSDGKVDYAKRGYVLPVEKDECIIEYIKPQMGVAGRNCRGVYIPIKEPKKVIETAISVSENIIKKESETSIKYVANRGGFVNFEKGIYDVQEQMEINEISFRSTGSIDASVMSNIKINIKEKDILKDAIGAGMSVETSELIVQGNVGSGAKIKAKIVDIGGQTHQSAYIESDQITIAVHRGEANGQTIIIDRLEGGKVFGDTVSVKQMIGGEIVAKIVKIENLLSNAKITASEVIEITELKGNNNKFIIDPSVTKEFNEQIKDVSEKIHKNEEELKAYPRQLSTKKDLIDKNKPMAEMVKSKITELKQSGVEPPLSLYAKIKDFQEKVVEYNALLQTFKDKKEYLNELQSELRTVQMKVFSAKIINHSVWKEYNEIRFRLITPAKEITYNPKERELAREIMLKDLGNGEFKILRSMEYSGK